MSALKREWTDMECDELDHDIKAAKVKVFEKHGFTTEEIAKVINLPESTVRVMLSKQL